MTNASQAIQVARQANIKVQCSIHDVTVFSLWYINALIDCYIRVFFALYLIVGNF